VRPIAAGTTAAAVRPLRVLYAAAALSLLAALIHLWVTPEHLEEWWGYGAFFLVTALAQALYAPLVAGLAHPDSLAGGHRGQPCHRGAVPPDADGGGPFVRAGGRRGREYRLRRLVRHDHGGRDRRGAGGGAVTGNLHPEEAHDPALVGRGVGLGRARGAPGGACLLSLGPRVRASALAGRLPTRASWNAGPPPARLDRVFWTPGFLPQVFLAYPQSLGPACAWSGARPSGAALQGPRSTQPTLRSWPRAAGRTPRAPLAPPQAVQQRHGPAPGRAAPTSYSTLRTFSACSPFLPRVGS